MPHLRPSIGVDALNCQSHHAPSNHHLGRGKAASVEDIARLFNIPFYKLGAGKESA